MQHLEAIKKLTTNFFIGLVRSITCDIPPPKRNFTQLSHVTVDKEQYLNYAFENNNLLFICVSELLKIPQFKNENSYCNPHIGCPFSSKGL